MQVDPVKSKLKTPASYLLKLIQFDILPSTFAFKSNLRRFRMDMQSDNGALRDPVAGAVTRPLLTST